MIIGSLEGSIGSIGGFCVGASIVIEHQRLSGLGYCFSASLPPFLSKISIYTLELFEKNPELFEKLRNISIQMDKHLRALEFYEVLSDPLSPLKVLTVTGDVDKIHNYVSNVTTKRSQFHKPLAVYSEKAVLSTVGEQPVFECEYVHVRRGNRQDYKHFKRSQP